jgi:hypothetical protein
VKALVVVLLVGCGHIPKGDPAGVPPPWPATPAPVKSAPPPPAEKTDEKKPLQPPLKALPPSQS